MNRILVLACLLGGAYLYLAQTGSPLLRHSHVGGTFGGGGSLNPVMGDMAGSVGAGAVKAAGKVGG
jgi:hypothetical protein